MWTSSDPFVLGDNVAGLVELGRLTTLGGHGLDQFQVALIPFGRFDAKSRMNSTRATGQIQNATDLTVHEVMLRVDIPYAGDQVAQLLFWTATHEPPEFS